MDLREVAGSQWDPATPPFCRRGLSGACVRSARVRAAHLLDRSLNSAPISRLILLALPLAFSGPLGGLQFGLVTMRTDKAPRVVMDCVAVHGPSSLPIEHSVSLLAGLLHAMR